MAKGKGKGGFLGKGTLGPTPKALRPRSNKRLRRQATRLVKKAYRPVFHELNTQERKAKAIAAKRKNDNEYYQQWLQSQSEQLRAHAQAADQQLLATQSQIQQDAAAADQALRQSLVEQGQQNAGNVSNAAQATAFDNTAEAAHGQSLIAAERMRSAQAVGTRAESADARDASNIAQVASLEYKRQADLSNALKEVASAKQKAALERSAKISEEVARLLDQEIAKAQSVVDMRNLAAQAALDLKNFRLAKKNYKLNKRVQLGELSLAKRAQREEERSNRAGERLDRAGLRQDAAKDRRDAKQDRRESRQERRERERKIKHVVNNTISAIASNPRWQKVGARDQRKLVNILIRRGVAEPVFARAAVDLMFKAHLSKDSIRALRNIGLKNIPKKWTRKVRNG